MSWLVPFELRLDEASSHADAKQKALGLLLKGTSIPESHLSVGKPRLVADQPSPQRERGVVHWTDSDYGDWKR